MAASTTGRSVATSMDVIEISDSDDDETDSSYAENNIRIVRKLPEVINVQEKAPRSNVQNVVLVPVQILTVPSATGTHNIKGVVQLTSSTGVNGTPVDINGTPSLRVVNGRSQTVVTKSKRPVPRAATRPDQSHNTVKHLIAVRKEPPDQRHGSYWHNLESSSEEESTDSHSGRVKHQLLERRRRHDMTYKFHLLQSLLYPNSEKMSKQFILDAATKTIQGLVQEYAQLTKEKEYLAQRRDWLVSKIKALKESEKNQYAAITVNEETGSRVVISDPILASPKKSPRCRKASSRYQDYIVQSVRPKPPKATPKQPLTAFQKLLASRNTSTKKQVQPLSQNKTRKGTESEATQVKNTEPLMASQLLGTMAEDVLRSMKQQTTAAAADNKKPTATSANPSDVIASKAKPVTLHQLEKQEVVLTKCEKCNERVAFSSRFPMDIKCPMCGFVIFQNDSDTPEATSSELPSDPNHDNILCLDEYPTPLKAKSSDDSDKSCSTRTRSSSQQTASSRDVQAILKDGVQGYVDNVGEDEVIVIVKDENKPDPAADSSPTSSVQEPEVFIQDDTSDTDLQQQNGKVRKKLGF